MSACNLISRDDFKHWLFTSGFLKKKPKKFHLWYLINHKIWLFSDRIFRAFATPATTVDFHGKKEQFIDCFIIWSVWVFECLSADKTHYMCIVYCVEREKNGHFQEIQGSCKFHSQKGSLFALNRQFTLPLIDTNAYS